MPVASRPSLEDVQAVYAGPEGRVWELIMGEQIHIGGLASSLHLAARAGIRAGSKGVDLCCCTGAGMRFLTRFRGVGHMTGVDVTARMVELGRQRCADEGCADRISFVLADACDSGLADDCMDFAWGEDAWCYVANKARLIREASRIVRPGGTIAFTDWLEGPRRLTPEERERFCMFMKFPGLETVAGYRALLTDAGCEVVVAEDTGCFAKFVDLYVDMLNMQLGYDALKIVGWDQSILQTLGAEMQFLKQLAHAGRVTQGIFVARVC